MASKNNLQPKSNAKNNIDKWSHLTGYELPNGITDKSYTRDQIRALAAKYGIKNYSSYKNATELAEAIQNTNAYKQAAKKPTKKTEPKNYKTLFEQIRDETGGRKQSKEWYRKKLFEKTPNEIINDERTDNVGDKFEKDTNVLSAYPKAHNLMIYQYKAKWRRDLPFYDKYPLVFALEMHNNYFFGVNLHYYSPDERIGIASNLTNNRSTRFRKGAHKYLLSEVRSPFLILTREEWQTICLLPIEEFVRDLNGVEIPILSEKVWSK